MRKIAKYLFAMLLCFFCFTAFIACGELEIDSATIKEGTMDLTIEQGGSLDTSNAKLVIKYKDGTTKEVPTNELEFDKSGVNTEEVGDHTLKVKYDGKEFEITVKVTQKVTVTGLVNKNGTVILVKGGTVDTSTIALRVNFSNGTYQDIENTAVTFDTTTVNTNNLGLQNLKVTYEGVDYNIPVYVQEDTSVESANIKTGTMSLSIFAGQTFNDSNAVLVLYLKNGTQREISRNDLAFDYSNVNQNQAGTYAVKVRYGSEEYTINVTVTAVSVSSVTNKLGVIRIAQNGTIDKSTITLVVAYNNGSSNEIQGNSNEVTIDLTTVNTATLGAQSLKVTYDGVDYTIPVEVVADDTISAYDIKTGTMSKQIYETETFDDSDAVLVLEYKDGRQNLEVPRNQLTFDYSGVNTNVAGSYTLKVSYDGDVYNISVTVLDLIETEVVNKTGTIVVTQHTAFNTSGVVLVINYNNGDSIEVQNADLLFDTTCIDTSVLGNQTLKVGYGGKTYNLPVSIVKDTRVKNVALKNGSVDLTIFVGQTVDISNAAIIVTYQNNTTEEIPASQLTFDLTAVNNQVAGSYPIAVTYNSVQYPAVASVVVSNVLIENAYIKAGTMKTEINQGESLNLTGAVLVLEYSDGSSTEIPTAELQFDTSAINTLAAGTQILKVTYGGEEYDIKIEVNAIQVTSFSSAVKTNYATNSSANVDKQLEFAELNKIYLVGDDNAMDWQIKAAGITEDAQILEDLKQVETNITIKRFVGGSQEYETLDADGKANSVDYIDSIDRYNQLVDFSENAVGETFIVKIELVHYSEGMFNAQNPPYIEHEIQVVDGYNVYDAYGLSLYDNANNDVDEDYVAFAGTQKWSDLKAEWEDAGLVEEGFAELSPNALVLHNDIEITKNVIPNKNFYKKTAENATLFAQKQAKTNEELDGSFIDDRHHAIYVRMVDDEDNFNLYGNYFNINASKLTRSVVDDDGNGIINTEDNSNESYITMHMPLFRATGGEYNASDGTWTSHSSLSNSKGSVKFQDLSIVGNGQRGADALYSGGVILLKALSCNFTAENTIHKDFHIGYFTEYGRDYTMIDIAADTALTEDHINTIKSAIGTATIAGLNLTVGATLTAENITAINTEIAQNGNAGLNNHFKFINNKAYNDYNTFMYVWGSPNVYIEGGEMVSCGGPAIIADHVNNGYLTWDQEASLTNNGANGSPSYINVVGTKIENKVFGTEPWFNTYNATGTFSTIKNADELFNNGLKQLGQALSQQFSTTINYPTKTFLTTNTDSNVPGFINMIFLYKYGAKELPTSGAIIRGYFRQFDTIEDYNAYYSTGKLADGSNYYGFESNGIVSLTSKGSYSATGEQGRFESQSNGAAAAMVNDPSPMANPATITPSPTSQTDFNYGAGDYANVYLCNGFGAVFQLFDYTAPEA